MAAASEFSEDDEDDEDDDDDDEEDDGAAVGITMRPPMCTGALFLAESEFNALLADVDDCLHG